MRLFLILTISVALTDSIACVGSEGKPSARMLELASTQHSFAADDDLILWYRLVNCGQSDYSENMPYEFRGLIWDWFDVFLNGRKLDNRLARKDYGFAKRTKLGPGESVTIAFLLSTICELPSKGEARVGHYTVKARQLTDNAKPNMPIIIANELSFRVVGGSQEASREGLSTEHSDLDLARRFLACPRVCSNDKLHYLRAIQKTAAPETFRMLFSICDDGYVQTVLLDAMQDNVAPVSFLLGFVQSQDLSVRRACLRNLASRELASEQKLKLSAAIHKGDEVVDELMETIKSTPLKKP